RRRRALLLLLVGPQRFAAPLRHAGGWCGLGTHDRVARRTISVRRNEGDRPRGLPPAVGLRRFRRGRRPRRDAEPMTITSPSPASDELGFILVGVVMFMLALTILGLS